MPKGPDATLHNSDAGASSISPQSPYSSLLSYNLLSSQHSYSSSARSRVSVASKCSLSRSSKCSLAYLRRMKRDLRSARVCMSGLVGLVGRGCLWARGLHLVCGACMKTSSRHGKLNRCLDRFHVWLPFAAVRRDKSLYGRVMRNELWYCEVAKIHFDLSECSKKSSSCFHLLASKAVNWTLLSTRAARFLTLLPWLC